MKQDSIFYDDYDMKLKELLESMRTYPSLSEALDEICNEVQSKQDTISSLKKRIKYCKNPIEKKNLERELNDLYKKRKTILKIAIDVQVVLRILVDKEIATREEVQKYREEVSNSPKYKIVLDDIKRQKAGFQAAKDNPQEYLQALLRAKMNGNIK